MTKIVVTSKISAGKNISVVHICAFWNDPYPPYEGDTFETLIGCTSLNIIKTLCFLMEKFCKISSLCHITKSEVNI